MSRAGRPSGRPGAVAGAGAATRASSAADGRRARDGGLDAPGLAAAAATASRAPRWLRGGAHVERSGASAQRFVFASDVQGPLSPVAAAYLVQPAPHAALPVRAAVLSRARARHRGHRPGASTICCASSMQTGCRVIMDHHALRDAAYRGALPTAVGDRARGHRRRVPRPRGRAAGGAPARALAGGASRRCRCGLAARGAAEAGVLSCPRARRSIPARLRRARED